MNRRLLLALLLPPALAWGQDSREPVRIPLPDLTPSPRRDTRDDFARDYWRDQEARRERQEQEYRLRQDLEYRLWQERTFPQR